MAMSDETFLRQKGIQKRMQCNAATASRIKDAFVTAEQLVDAVESGDPLMERDGIGPSTAQTIRDWWEVRFEREKKMPSGSVKDRTKRSATIVLHSSWPDALGMEVDDAGF